MLFVMLFIRETLPNNLQAAIFETRIEWEKSKMFHNSKQRIRKIKKPYCLPLAGFADQIEIISRQYTFLDLCFFFLMRGKQPEVIAHCRSVMLP